MSAHSPYTPPEAGLTEVPEPPPRFWLYLIAGLASLHLLSCLSNFWFFLDLINYGAMTPTGALFYFPACLCLYVAAILLLFRPDGGKILFLIAGLGLTLTVAIWLSRYSTIFSPTVYVPGYGAMIAFWGFCLARSGQRYLRQIVAQPNAGVEI